MKQFCTILIALLLFSCAKQVKIKVENTTKQLNHKNTYFEVNQGKTELQLKFSFTPEAEFPFPVTDKDTLSETEFNCDFYFKDKPVLLPAQFESGSYWRARKDTINMSFVYSTDKLKDAAHYQTICVPYYALLNIPQGEQELVVKIYQTKFQKTTQDSLGYSKVLTKEETLISADVRFKIKIPEIHKATISIKGLELFSSKGADFSLIGKGNADIYWQLDYPIGEKIYFESPVLKNTSIYNKEISINLYYYPNEPKFKISVLDSDFLSRDDLLDEWELRLTDLFNNNNYKELTKKNVKWLKIKVNNHGAIN